MTNVTVTDTVYNITVSETNQSVTVESGDAITVLVDTFTISTNVVNLGGGAEIGASIVGDTLNLRTITAGDDIVVTQNANDIVIALSGTIDADVIGNTTGTHFGPVQGNVTGNVTGSVSGNINSTDSTINVINDVLQINNTTNNITISPQASGFLHANVGNLYVGTFTQAAHITPTEIKSIGTPLEITGNLTGNVTGDLSGNVTGQVSDISNHTTDDLTEGSTNLYYTDARSRAAVSASGSISYDNTTGVISYTQPTNVSAFINDAGYLTAETITGISNVVDDTSPQLGGNLDTNGFDIDFADNNKATFGTGEDLWIYHDGGSSYIFDRGFGNLRIVTNSTVNIDGASGGEFMAQFVSNGAVSLWHDNSKKFDTTSTGVSITGEITTTGGNSTNWNTAYGWGDHAAVGYLQNLNGLTTSDLAEGTNLYYTDARVQTLLGNVSGHIIPSANVTYDLGSPTNQWREVYIGPGSLYIDGQKVLGSDEAGDIDITTDAGQNLNISSGADIQFLQQANASGTQAFTVNLVDINLGPAAGGATVTVNGILETPDLHLGDLQLNGTLFNSTATNQNLEIRTNGTGYLHANVADLYVGPLSGAVKIDGNTISSTVGDLTITGNLTGNVTGQVSDISNHDTDDLTEGLTNLYYTDARVDAHLQSGNVTEVDISGYVLTPDAIYGTLDLAYPNGVSLQVGQEQHIYAKATEAISAGDAVMFAGAQGDHLLIALADQSSPGYLPEYLIGVAAQNFSNNQFGYVASFGRVIGIKTDYAGWTEGTLLYLDPDTPGKFVTVEPSPPDHIQLVAAVTRVNANDGTIFVRPTHRPDTDEVPEGVTNLYYTDTRFDNRLATKTTTDLAEGTNLYYTDARSRAAISATGSLSYDNITGVISYTQPVNISAFTNDVGYITDYTVTEADVTAHQAALVITESQISDLTHYTDSEAIAAVEGEATLNLTGVVTMAQDLDVSGLITVDDGFSFGSFNPFAGSGLPATPMPTTIMGVGQESGWAGLTLRSRGEHDWGLSGFGIPPAAPRALLGLAAGRLDTGSDDYLNNNDRFASVVFNPYSGFRTGTEWLTPSIELEAVATENHSASGMGTKLVIHTTENGSVAAGNATTHANKTITIQGTTITTSDTLKIDDDLQITGQISNPSGDIVINDKVEIKGSNVKETVIGDDTIAGVFDIHGIKIKADDTAWASMILQEYEGGANKPFANGFLNPSFGTEIIGGTPSSPSNVSNGKRLFLLQALAANQANGTLPTTASFRIKAETTETQTTSGRGTKVTIDTIPNGQTATTETLSMQGDELTINSGGDGIIRAGGVLKLGSNLDTNGRTISNGNGDVTVDDNLKVNSALTVDGTANLNGNVNLGNANTDSIQANGKLKANNGFGFTVINTATANFLISIGAVATGDAAFITDGDAGSPCLAVYDGSSWKRIALGATIATS